MTTTALAAVPPDAARPVSWSRLGWVTWRRHRTTVLATLGLLGLLAIYLVITGLQIRSAWNTVQACTPQQSSACNFEWNNFRDTHSDPGLLSALFILAPMLIGGFAGAPLVGRELETGTVRYAWTQGVGRTRWAIALLVPGAVFVAVAAGALGVLIAWHDHPLVQADISQRLAPNGFPATGVAIVGWSLLAYAIGVLAGLLWRRVLPALATAVLTTFGLGFAASRFRLHYLPPLKTTSLDHVPGSVALDQWWEKAGARVGEADLNAVLQAAGVSQIQTSGGKTTVHVGINSTDPITYLTRHGYDQWTSYQPAGRYWTFQWIEFGWLAVLAVLLITATVLLVRRRDA